MWMVRWEKGVYYLGVKMGETLEPGFLGVMGIMGS